MEKKEKKFEKLEYGTLKDVIIVSRVQMSRTL